MRLGLGRIGISTVFAALVLAGCAGQPGLAPRRPAPPPDPRTQLAPLEQRIFVLVEAARLKADPAAKPLTLDRELTGIARVHSEAMAHEHFLGHRGPDGETTASLMMARDKTFQGLLGENIAAQYYTKAAGIDVKAYAQRFVETWMHSKSHRDNLAFPDYSRTGVGVAIDHNEVFVTQLFADAITPNSNATKGAPREVARYSDPKVAKQATPFARTKAGAGATHLGKQPQ